jgi:hypothetical protein
MEKAASASAVIDARLKELGDWRGSMLSRLRALIRQADPNVVEEWKWAKATSPGVPVWSHEGIICTGEVYKDKVKMTFARGASLADPKTPLQRQSRREHTAGDRFSRGRQDRRDGVENAHPRGCSPECVQGAPLGSFPARLDGRLEVHARS